MSEPAATESGVVEAPGPGTQLQQAREARGLSLAEVAAALKMSPRQIEAMEIEDFSRLGGATFVRGFVRNYAKLLKIDPAPVLAAVATRVEMPAPELNVSGGSGVRMPAGGERTRSSYGAAIVAAALLAIALGLYFDVVDFDLPLPRKAAGPVAVAVPAPSSSSVLPAQTTEPAAILAAPPAAPAAEPGKAAMAEAGAERAPAAVRMQSAPMPGMGQLVFSFDANAWVEVKDKRGVTVFSQLSPKGSTQTVEGAGPFQVVVGNASHVRLTYNEQPVDLRPHTRVDVARLTVE